MIWRNQCYATGCPWSARYHIDIDGVLIQSCLDHLPQDYRTDEEEKRIQERIAERQGRNGNG
jgi:hypothetical protein